MYAAIATIISAGSAYLASQEQARATRNAAGQAAEASAAANATQQGMFDMTREDFAPYQQVGLAALPSLYSMLGNNVQSLTPEIRQQYIQEQLKNDSGLNELLNERKSWEERYKGDTFHGSAGHKRADAYYAELKRLNSAIDARQGEITAGRAIDEQPVVSVGGKLYSSNPAMVQERIFDPKKEDAAMTAAEQARVTGEGQMIGEYKTGLEGAATDRSNAIKNYDYKVDPGFKFMQDEGLRSLNEQLAGRGKYFSGRAVEQGVNNLNNRLLGQEYDKLYNRNVTEANTGYDINSSRLSDLYNKNLGALDTRYNSAAAGYNRRNELDTSQYSRLTDLLKIGQGAAGSVSNMGANTANQISNNQVNLGNTLASASIAQGQNKGNMYTGIGNSLSSLINNPQFQSMFK